MSAAIEIAEAERRSVGENGAEHHQRHHEGALRGDLGAGEDAVGGRADHTNDGRDLLDRPQESGGRDGGEDRPGDPEEPAGREHHVKAGDRYNVGLVNLAVLLFPD
jgi:hypothetical protein